MIDTFAKIILVESIKESIKAFSKKLSDGTISGMDKKATIDAIISIQKATIKTRLFISDYGYKRNEELTELWHQTLNKVLLANVDENLPEYLFYKAQFWGEPKDWLNTPQTLELVPKLTQLDQKCEMLLSQLKN